MTKAQRALVVNSGSAIIFHNDRYIANSADASLRTSWVLTLPYGNCTFSVSLNLSFTT